MSWSIAERVETLRKEKGWTKTELARRSGLNQMHVYKICAGIRTKIEAETIRKLARAFGTTTDYLLGMDAEDESENEMEPADAVLV
jgi:transcriptional regulator with XRE-family HTH domain